MRHLLGLLIFVVIVGMVLLGAMAYVSEKFATTPADFEFIRESSEITSVECISVSFVGGQFSYEKLGQVEDLDAFTNEIYALECHKGISLDSFTALAKAEDGKGFLITYSDGSYEIITPYVCINSDMKISAPEDILSADVYGFKSEDIDALIQKYSK